MPIAVLMKLATLLLLSACVTPGSDSTSESEMSSSSESPKMAAPWFQGSVEDAFATAKSDGKPILLYWGAQWCPPCNEMKAQVFSQPRFKELMQPVVAVQLDGDQEGAQAWGEKLAIKGYPTILLLSSTGEEWMRLDIGVNYDEFALAFNAALSTRDNIQQVLSRVTQGQARATDWPMVARFSWSQAHNWQVTPAERLRMRSQVATAAKTSADCALPLRAKMMAELLAEAAGHHDSTDATIKQVVNDIKKSAADDWTAILKDPVSRRAARSTIIYDSAVVVNWIYGEKGKERDEAAQAVLAAVDQLAQDETLSVDTRLWSVYPHLVLANKKEATAAVRQKIADAVARADARATTTYERKAVISGAAYLLRQVKDYDRAEALLQKELKKTDTPWYIESSLAALARDRGQAEAALRWSAAARSSVRGRASKLQWIVNDVGMSVRFKNKIEAGRLANLLQEFYDTAFALSDGFMGRNQLRVTMLAKHLQAVRQDPQVRSQLQASAGRCSGLQAQAKANCENHFKGLL